jgi:DNA-binding LacI/PurR family transcriptional regulator
MGTRLRSVYATKKEAVRKALLKQEKKDGDSFYMTLKDMAKKFKTSLGTMSKIVASLQDEGVLKSVQGKGVFIGQSQEAKKCICWFVSTSWNSEHPYNKELKKGILDACKKFMFSFMFFHIPNENYDETRMHFMYKMLNSQIINGIILSSERFHELANSYHIPYAVTHPVNDPEIWSVSRDGYNNVLDFLTGLGHRNLAIVANDIHMKNLQKGDLRQNKIIIGADKYYLSYTEKNLIDGRQEWYLKGNMQNEKLPYEILDWYRGETEKPSALLISDATVAWEIVNIFRDAGIKVPDDVSIAGIGSSQVNEELSMWEIPAYKIGEAAVKLLKRQMDNDTDYPRQESIIGKMRFGKTAKIYIGGCR